jgi:uncharacterized membrane protein YedE/YeeE
MNTLGDADTLAVVISLLTLAGAIAFASTWSAHLNKVQLHSAYGALIGLVVLSLATLITIAVMYLKTRNDIFVLAPTHDDIKVAIILVAGHVLNLVWLGFVYRRICYKQKQSVFN